MQPINMIMNYYLLRQETQKRLHDLDADEDELVIVEDSVVSWHSFVSIAL